MNKVDFIYYKLCKKYNNNVAMKRNIVNYIDMKPSEENPELFEYKEDLGETLGSIYFINLANNTKIDLRKEQEEGTFNE